MGIQFSTDINNLELDTKVNAIGPSPTISITVDVAPFSYPI